MSYVISYNKAHKRGTEFLRRHIGSPTVRQRRPIYNRPEQSRLSPTLARPASRLWAILRLNLSRDCAYQTHWIAQSIIYIKAHLLIRAIFSILYLYVPPSTYVVITRYKS